MKLLKLSYKDSDWELKDLELDSVNLIVAKNSTGKSRTLTRLDLLVKIITQRRYSTWGETWKIEFSTFTNQIIIYEFATSGKEKGIVTTERMLIDGIEYLSREENGFAKIKNNLSDTFDEVYPPKNKLVLHTNRDVKKYPFLEEITTWAENSFGFRFANIIPYSKANLTLSGLLNTVEDIPELFNSLSVNSRENILTQFNDIGYNISQITPERNSESIMLLIKENNVTKTLSHNLLAQGMFRALSIIIFIEYLISNKKPAMVIVDDLCEGLDYERAKKLGELIFKKCLDSDIQLVATSNDVFLMDVVDIKYWNILMRTGKVVTALNNKNNPKLFTDFRFTGLSNFDFFSSDFLKQELK